MIRKKERKKWKKEGWKGGRKKGNEPHNLVSFILYGPTHWINTVHSVLASSLASFHCWLVEKLMVSNNTSPELLSSLLPVDIIALKKKKNLNVWLDFIFHFGLSPDHLDGSNYLYILLLDKKPTIENVTIYCSDYTDFYNY